MSAVDDLVAFLRARYDADERVAEAADVFAPLYWVADDGKDGFVVTVDELLNMPQEDIDAGRLPAKAKSKNPGPWHTLPNVNRMLLDIESKRRILDEVLAECSESGLDPGQGIYGRTLRLLALPYVDHDDYRAEWRP